MHKILVFAAVMCLLGSAQSFGQNAYIANALSDDVSVIDTKTNTAIGAPIPVGNLPWGVAVSPNGTRVYVTNINSGTVSVIDTRTNTAVATFPAGHNPYGVAVSPDGARLYVANDNSAASTITVINAETGATIAAIPTGNGNGNSTAGVTVSPDGKKVYAVNLSTGEDAVSVIDAATNAVVATISTPGKWNAYQAAFLPDGTKAYLSQTQVSSTAAPVLTVIDVATSTVVDTIVLGNPGGTLVDATDGVVVSPDGKRVYVVNDLLASGQSFIYSQVSVIDTATDAIVAAIPINANASAGISITPDGTKLYVINTFANSVTVVDTRTNATTAVIPVGSFPISAGNFIQPLPRFAGTPGKANCYGKSVSALVRQYHGLHAAAAALGFRRVEALEEAILDFCEKRDFSEDAR